ncbi:hypothetical protein ColTof4_05244 [Colletotrichum tofieldiae]|nr:hypothetical protein ColTof3_10505 [Colletotrichum tofieldiae]GKT72821.1 hypothetical protein ColTof4_05244 [Colletotrichum tofieldiae]
MNRWLHPSPFAGSAINPTKMRASFSGENSIAGLTAARVDALAELSGGLGHDNLGLVPAR